MLRSTFRDKNLKFLLCIFTSTIAWEVFSFSIKRPYRVLTSTDTDMIKILTPNICFYFMASARAALGKKKHKQTKKTHKFHCFTLYCGSLSKQAPGHGMWPLGNHGNHWAAPQMQPLSQPGQQSHLPEQSHLKPVLDWALKSSQVFKSGLGGR